MEIFCNMQVIYSTTQLMGLKATDLMGEKKTMWDVEVKQFMMDLKKNNKFIWICDELFDYQIRLIKDSVLILSIADSVVTLIFICII